jgi:hypothetical protein
MWSNDSSPILKAAELRQAIEKGSAAHAEQ